MAKIIYIYSRKPLPDTTEKKLNDICSKLSPDNITSNKPAISVTVNTASAIINPTGTYLQKDNSIFLGQLFEKNENWDISEEEFPDGSYALFRDSTEQVEVVSDPAASKTIWYYFDDSIFVASTSQRAIILYLGNFEFDEKVIPWMLSTGSLGPGFSWDKRIKQIAPDSSVMLNKNEWTLAYKTNQIEFKPAERSDEEHESLLRKALDETFRSLETDLSDWILPLSGGYDSRGILCFLQKTGKKITKTVTWALNSSLNKKGSDASAAKELAEKAKLSNKFYPTDISDERLETLLNRFFLNGEGRIDYFLGFAEGFIIWKGLFEEGVTGIINGDECFGGAEVSSALTVRRTIGACLCSDFGNLGNHEKYGIPLQRLPSKLEQKQNESLSDWRDRLFQEYRLPVILAAVSDLKLSYVEEMNPLLSKNIIKLVRELPEHLRKDKYLFKKIVSECSKNVKFTTSEEDAVPKDVCRSGEFVQLLKKELTSAEAKEVFSSKFLELITKEIQTIPVSKTSSSFVLLIKKLIPRSVKNILRDKISLPNIDPNVLAFRVFIVCRMNKMLKSGIS